MAERAAVTLQHGIWIDGQQLANAGLQGELEITIEPGEIRIRSAEAGVAFPADASDELFLKLSGILSGPPLSASDVERVLYGDEEGIQQVVTDDDHFLHVGMGFEKIP